MSWESLGHQGRIFVAGGPRVDELSAFNGAPATEPIRAYAGLDSADGITATAELAARELQRTGGLQRAVVAVATTTGTGWINEAEADALEYMYNGNTAIVSMQYSFLPSWLSFLVDKENARHAGQALFEAVDKLVRADCRRPAAQARRVRREPGLVRRRGAVPEPQQRAGPHRRRAVQRTDVQQHHLDRPDRDARRGSPEWLPIYDDGQNVRFVARAKRSAPPDPPWDTPRVVYLQHASDPIAWWTSRPAVQRAGLAAREARLRRASRDALDPGGDVPAGVGRHGGGRGRARRARPPLRRRRRRRLGRRPVTARLDAGEDALRPLLHATLATPTARLRASGRPAPPVSASTASTGRAPASSRSTPAPASAW